MSVVGNAIIATGLFFASIQKNDTYYLHDIQHYWSMCSTEADVTTVLEAAIQSVFNDDTNGCINLDGVSIRDTLCDVVITCMGCFHNGHNEFLIRIKQDLSSASTALRNFEYISQNYRYVCCSTADVLNCIKSLQSANGILISGASYTFRESLIGYVSGTCLISDVCSAWRAHRVGTHVSVVETHIDNKQIIVPNININNRVYHFGIQEHFIRTKNVFTLRIMSAACKEQTYATYQYSCITDVFEALMRVRVDNNGAAIIDSANMADARKYLRVFCESV